MKKFSRLLCFQITFVYLLKAFTNVAHGFFYLSKCDNIQMAHFSNHLSDLPLVLVFGIATAVTTVHRLLPSGVSSLMCIEKFQAPPSSEYLSQVIDKVDSF